MTESIKLSTLATAIASQSITVTNAYGSSVTLDIRDITEIPVSVNQQDCPILTPHPSAFMTNVTVTRDSYGADAGYKSVEYDLTYRFFFAPILQSVTMLEKYDEFITAAMTVLMFFTDHTNLSGSTDFLPGSVPAFGAVVDGAGTQFHGCDFVFHVRQYLEA
jgi:hypothetical protein